MNLDQRPLLLTEDEAATTLAVSKRTLQSLIYSGVLPSVKIGRSRRVAAADLELYVGRLRDESENDREAWQPAVVGGSGGARHHR